MNDSYRIRKSLSFSDINWSSVEQILLNRFHYTAGQIRRLRHTFARRFTLPVLPGDFVARTLSSDAECVVAAICQTVGADVIELKRIKKLSLFVGNVSFLQSIHFFPNLSLAENQSPGFYRVKYQVDLFNRVLLIDNFKRALIGNLVLFIFSSALYASLIYPLAVLLYFFTNPATVILAATHNLSIGLSLIASLVVIASLLGKLSRAAIQKSRLSRGQSE